MDSTLTLFDKITLEGTTRTYNNMLQQTHQTLCSLHNIIRESSCSNFIQWNECVSTFQLSIAYQLFTGHFRVYNNIVELKIFGKKTLSIGEKPSLS